MQLRLSDFPLCRPMQPIGAVSVQALGDFPSSSGETTAFVGTGGRPAAIDSFPVSTRELKVEAQRSEGWRGGSLVVVGRTDEQVAALLLPSGRSCVLGGPQLGVPEEAAIAPLPNGELLVAGGREGGVALRRVTRLVPGSGEAKADENGLLLRREGATATLTGSVVVIAGGGQGSIGTAHDTFEVYDTTLGELDRNAARNLSEPRRNHGAGALPDGRVLLVGGVSDTEGPPLRSAVLIDPAKNFAEQQVGTLPFPRDQPSVSVLDDGTVLVLGGRSSTGVATGTIAAFNPLTLGFSAISNVELPPRDGAVAVVLPGARVAWVGGELAGVPATEINVLRRLPPDLPGVPALERIDVDFTGSMLPLRQVRSVALRDGSLLVVGADETERTRAYVIDVGTRTLLETDTSRLPRYLVALADGMTLEADSQGSSARREIVISEYDEALLLSSQSDGLAFDAPGHWDKGEGFLRARVDDARVDVPTLRFTRMELELDARGSKVDLLLAPSENLPVSVGLSDETAGPPTCEIPRVETAPLLLRRDANRITIVAGSDTRECTLNALGERIGIAIRAQQGAEIHALRIERQ